jgi:diguanylate cyclase (GGDEF)-like protein
MPASESTKNKLILLKKKYARQAPEKIRQIEEALSALLEKGPDKERLAEVLRMVHTLSGSSSSLGFSALGSAAKKLENLLKECMNDDASVKAAIKPLIDSYVDEIRLKAGNADEVPAEQLLPGCTAPQTALTTEDKKLIYLAEDDQFILDTLSLQIGHFGYQVKAFSRPSDLLAAIQDQTPSAIITDIIFPEGDTAGIEISREIKKNHAQLPIVFISNRDDLKARISAARAGGEAYLLKPLIVGNLIDKLDSLINKVSAQDPYRVLIVDDDPELASYNSLILEEAGMKTMIITDPLKVMSPLIDFNPDLILMDMYMPGCNGLELAKVIRQIESHVSIPIVFLSSETNISKQLAAMSMGGDDFLTKPIQPGHLISSVSIRAERMRIIRSFMDRDSLTGLLNHTKIKEQLDFQIERASRTGDPVVFAMIDIDKFKTVNDTYGHPTGDRVILSLSRLLQQRLRKIDVIGRYGGEEFASVLMNTDARLAKIIFDEIRESFSQIRQQSDNREFTVTFSCGIASFPQFTTAKVVCSAADQALYTAKHNGRNRVFIAS